MNNFNENTGLNPSQPTQSNFAAALGITSLISSGAEVAGMFGVSKAASGDTKELASAQKAMADAGVNVAKYNLEGQKVVAQAQKEGWDAQKIIQELQTKGVINTNEANKAIAKAQQYSTMYASIANITASKSSGANAKVAQDAANNRVIYWLGGIAVIGILAFVGFVFYKTKIK